MSLLGPRHCFPKQWRVFWVSASLLQHSGTILGFWASVLCGPGQAASLLRPFVLVFPPGSMACWGCCGPQPVCFPMGMANVPPTSAFDAAPPCRTLQVGDFVPPLQATAGSQTSPRGPQTLGAAAQPPAAHTGGQATPGSRTA